MIGSSVTTRSNVSGLKVSTVTAARARRPAGDRLGARAVRSKGPIDARARAEGLPGPP